MAGRENLRLLFFDLQSYAVIGPSFGGGIKLYVYGSQC